MTKLSARTSSKAFDARFALAARMLGASLPTERIAGIAMLCNLGDSLPERRGECAALLCGYLRSTPPGWDRTGRQMGLGESDVRNAIARALGQRLLVNASPSWRETPLDFQSAVFGDRTVFDHAHLVGTALFRGAWFNGVASFYGATFSCHAEPVLGDDDQGAVGTLSPEPGGAGTPHALATDESYREDVFTGTVFVGGANFARSVFTGRGQFSGAVFEAAADFADVEFRTHAAFIGASFQGVAQYSGCTVTSNLHFVASRFHHGMSLMGLRVGGWLDLTAAEIDGAADLSSAIIEQLCLDEVVFDGPLDLSHVAITYLEGSGATFLGAVVGDAAKITMGRLRDSWFMAAVDLDGAQLGEDTDGDEETVDFSGTIFEVDPVARLAPGSVIPDGAGLTGRGNVVTWRITRPGKRRG